MCIAIANKKGFPLKKEHFMNSWENNSHGGGLLYKEQGVLKCHYELTDKNAMYDVYIAKIKKSNVLVHFRITSKGSTTLDNCHPFMVNPELGFIHNGTIFSGLDPYGTEKSDTWAFNEQYCKMLPPDFYKYPKLMDIINSKVGNSKIAFMDIDETITIMGGEKGEAHHDAHGNWFSNKSYQAVNSYVWKGDVKVAKDGYKKLPATTNPYAKRPLATTPKPPRESYWDLYDSYRWDDDLKTTNQPTGFIHSMLIIAERAKKYRLFTRTATILCQLIHFKGKDTTIQGAMEQTFEDYLFDSSEIELTACLRHYIEEVVTTSKQLAL